MPRRILSAIISPLPNLGLSYHIRDCLAGLVVHPASSAEKVPSPVGINCLALNKYSNTVVGATVWGNPPQSPFAKGDIGGFGSPKFSNYFRDQFVVGGREQNSGIPGCLETYALGGQSNKIPVNV